LAPGGDLLLRPGRRIDFDELGSPSGAEALDGAGGALLEGRQEDRVPLRQRRQSATEGGGVQPPAAHRANARRGGDVKRPALCRHLLEDPERELAGGERQLAIATIADIAGS